MQDAYADGYVVASFPGVAYEDGAVVVGLQDTIGLLRMGRSTQVAV